VQEISCTELLTESNVTHYPVQPNIKSKA